MKKKQRQKLLDQFRPSLDDARGQLFRSLENESLRRHGLPLQVTLDPKNRQILTIGLAGRADEDTRISISINSNLNTVLKQIHSGGDDILERFRDNLLIEIVSYWDDQRLKNDEPTAQAVTTPVTEEAVSVPEEKVEEPKADTTENTRSTDTSAALSFADFSKIIAEYPKFCTERSEQETVIYEKNIDEPRKLATISMTAEDEFAIEEALEQKYKVKLTLIPLIGQFTATVIAEGQRHSTVETAEVSPLVE